MFKDLTKFRKTLMDYCCDLVRCLELIKVQERCKLEAGDESLGDLLKCFPETLKMDEYYKNAKTFLKSRLIIIDSYKNVIEEIYDKVERNSYELTSRGYIAAYSQLFCIQDTLEFSFDYKTNFNKMHRINKKMRHLLGF